MNEGDGAVTAERPIDLVVLVAGMHRSGTSALTGTLDRIGIPTPGVPMSATPENPRGYYESLAVMRFHEALLATIGSDWTDPEPIGPDLFWTAEGARWTADLVALIRRDLLSAGPTFAVKDPRLCRLLPLWRAALATLGATPRVLIPLRHPRAVAASLLERRGIEEDLALSLWLAHVLETERATRDLVRSFVVYDHLIDDPLPTVERLVDQLAAQDVVDVAGNWPSVRGFLTDELRRHRPHSPEGAAGTPHLADRCWASLQPFLASPHDLGAMHALNRIRGAVLSGRESGLSIALTRTRETGTTASLHAVAAMAAERERLAALEIRLDAALGELTALRSAVGQTQPTLDETRMPLGRIRRGLSTLRSRLGWKR